jgi:hypothetical protein
MRVAFIIGLAVALAAGAAQGQATAPSPPQISGSEAKALIAKVKATWRAQEGETADAITAKVAKIAHFIPRGWDIAQSGDGSKSVVLSWARHRADKEGDEYTITWDINPDGALTLGPPYAKPMDLGWQAFAISLIQSEIDDEDQGANRRFLHDVTNFNFVETAQGKLGDLLRRGKCGVGDPVGLDYLDKWGSDHPEQGDFWRLQLSVNCDVAGPQYFTRDGVILFLKRGKEAWQPQSFFAHRIATYAPGSWFERADPKEQEMFEAARKAFERTGGTK